MSMFQVEKRQRDAAKPKQLRKRGLLPMALVERSHETMLIQAPVEEIRRAMSRLDSHGRMEFKVEGEDTPRRAIVKHIEHDALRQELVHVTLQEVADDDTVKVDVPIVATGHNPDTDAAGVAFTTVTDHVKLRGRIADLPERIEIDVTNLGSGQHVSASDIALPAGVELLSPADAVLFAVAHVRGFDVDTPTDNADVATPEAQPES